MVVKLKKERFKDCSSWGFSKLIMKIKANNSKTSKDEKIDERKEGEEKQDHEERSENKKKFTLKSLAPQDNIDISVYKDLLNQMFEIKDVFNVGMTGPYGSGKSSTIETYKKQNLDKTFIHISLGKYDSIDTQSENTVLNKERDRNSNSSGKAKYILQRKQSIDTVQDTKEIEGKIINQLLHQVDIKNVPQAFTKVKKNNSDKNIITWSFIIPIILAFSIYVVRFESWVNLINNSSNSWLFILVNPFTRLCAIIILFIFIGYLTYLFGKAQINRALVKKISIKGNEVELFRDSKNSFFDEHLNEVVYLFENSEADVIVFEDLDRFNNPDIFRKLRELNQLINKRRTSISEKIDSPKKLIFLYLT